MSEMSVRGRLLPWPAPNHVFEEWPGVYGGRRLHLVGDLTADTLAQLCDDFRAEVFRKAGKVDPAREETSRG